MTTKILITGGCGFIGHHLVEHVLKNTNWDIIVLDSLTYASNGFDRLRDIKAYDDKRVKTLSANLITPITECLAKEIGDVKYIVHMAAESHVDNSIEDARPFVMSNVVGTLNILEFARTLHNLDMMIYFSTDEVFGPAPEGVKYKEWDRYNSTNPYSASKAGGEELCLAFANCYNLNVCVTHTMNVFGERQHPEKFIPLCIRSASSGDKVYIHANQECTQAGKRHYIHARNVADSVLFILENGKRRDKYNVVGEIELDNEELALKIAQMLGCSINYELVNFHSSRPGHDLRYALCGQKMKDMGWQPPSGFDESLYKTIMWTIENRKWLDVK